MLNFLRDKSIIKSNQILGVHCFLQSSGELQINYVLISRNKGKLAIEKMDSVCGGIEQLSNEVPSSIPVFLSLDGKGILTKKVTLDPAKSLIHQAIPNASEEEFTVQQFGGVDNQAFISLIRKNSLNDLLAQFNEQKFLVIGLALGPLKVINIRRLFENLPAELTIGVYKITCDRDNQIIDFSKEKEVSSETSYHIGDEKIPATFLLPYYHALTYYVPDADELQYPEITQQFEEFTSKRIFVVAGWSALIILFLILMVNMLYFTSFSDRQKILEAEVSGNKELLGKLKLLKDELTWKEKILGQSGIIGINRMSFYADQIAITVPAAITLEKFEINPVAAKIRKQKEIEIEPNKMTIDGVARNSEVLNDWVHVLKQQPWIGDVSVINYSKDEKSIPGTFSIEVKITGKK